MSESLMVRDYLGAIARRKGLLITVVLAAALSAAGFSLLLEPVYESEATYYLMREATIPTPITEPAVRPAMLPLTDRVLTAAYLEIIQSDGLVGQVLEEFPKVRRRSIAFSPSRSGFMLTVYVRHGDPQVAADVANAIGGAFREFLQVPVKERFSSSVARVDEEIADLDRRLEEASEARSELLQRINVASLRAEKESLEQLALDLEFDLRQAEIERDAMARQIESLEASRLHERTVQLAAEMEAQEAEIAGLRSQLSQARGRSFEINEASAELTEVDQRIQELRNDKLNRETVSNNQMLTALHDRNVLATAKTALPPRRPVFPLPGVNALAAALAALLPAVGYAMLTEGISVRRLARRLNRLAEQPWVAEILPEADGD